MADEKIRVHLRQPAVISQKFDSIKDAAEALARACSAYHSAGEEDDIQCPLGIFACPHGGVCHMVRAGDWEKMLERERKAAVACGGLLKMAHTKICGNCVFFTGAECSSKVMFHKVLDEVEGFYSGGAWLMVDPGTQGCCAFRPLPTRTTRRRKFRLCKHAGKKKAGRQETTPQTPKPNVPVRLPRRLLRQPMNRIGFSDKVLAKTDMSADEWELHRFICVEANGTVLLDSPLHDICVLDIVPYRGNEWAKGKRTSSEDYELL